MKPTTKRAIMNHLSEKNKREDERYGMFDRYDGRDNRGFGSAGEENRRSDANMRYGYGARNDYHEEVEDRFRDRRGREHYDNGRYAPMNESGMWIDDRYNGRVYNADRGNRDYGRTTRREDTRMGGRDYGYRNPTYPVFGEPKQKIGFSVDGEMERLPNDYKSDASYYTMDEMANRKGVRMNGYGESNAVMPLTKHMAKEWTSEMENFDGTHGAHWTLEQAKQVMAQKGIECDPVEFWVALCMMYSDYGEVAKKLGVNTIEFYACMAKAFLDDPDAADDKLARYYEYVVK